MPVADDTWRSLAGLNATEEDCPKDYLWWLAHLIPAPN